MLGLDTGCYTVDVDVRFTQSSAYCPGTGGTAGEVNNDISCDGGTTNRPITSGTFASGGDTWLTGCTPGGAVRIRKTTNGEFFPGPCNRTATVLFFSYRISQACQCRW